MKKLILALALIAAIAPSVGDSVSAQTVSKNGSRIYVEGLNPNAQYTIKVVNGTVSRRYLANPCGVIIVPASNGLQPTVSLNGGSVLTNNLVDRSAPRCVNGVLDIAAPDNFRTPSGQVGIVGQTPNFAALLDIQVLRTRNFTANACGTLQINTSTTFPAGNFLINESQTNNILPSTESSPPLCVDGVKYLADSNFPL